MSEVAHTLEIKTRLTDLLSKFENQYSLKSTDFYTRYQNGHMGDDMDFVEWSATVEMLENVEKRLALLNLESGA